MTRRGLRLFLVLVAGCSLLATAAPGQFEYRVLATSKTSTMQKEMQQFADGGFKFEGVMGGETSFGGSELVVVMSKEKDAPAAGRYQYRVLAANKTSTMQKEMQAAGDEGFDYRGQTVYESAFGGEEVVVVLERDRQAPGSRYEFKLLATSKTSTMQKELLDAGSSGFAFAGQTVAKTAFGGEELVFILRKKQ